MNIAIVDYSIGNIFNIQRAISFLGHNVVITDNPVRIFEADRIIIPGVGAFGDGIEALRKKKLDEALCKCADAGKPILGICIGMQIMMSESEEFGFHKGLNLIPGKVKRLPDTTQNGSRYKVPHVGWNKIFPLKSKSEPGGWERTVLQNNAAGNFFYFSHSYRVIPERGGDILAVTNYGGTEFCSVVRKGNIYGCQFHPELSGESGLKVLHEFITGVYSPQTIGKV